MSLSTNAIPKRNQTGDSILVLHGQAQWYAGQTCSRHEKSVTKQMDRLGIENFLPCYEKISRWKDRRVRLRLPLFPGYVFVRIALKDQLKVLQVPGIVRLVSFSGHPTAIPEQEILGLKRGLSSGVSVKPYPYLKAGQLVVVRSGPLAGLSGQLVRRKLKDRIVISLDSIMQSFIAEVSLDDIEIIQESRTSLAARRELSESRF